MIKRLSAVLLVGAVLSWGQITPAGAVPSLPGGVQVPVENLPGENPGDSDPLEEGGQGLDLVGGSGDVRRADMDASASKGAKKKCKKIKNQKKRKKCLKKAAGPKRIERTVEFEYVCPCVGQYQFGGLTGVNLGGGPITTGGDDVYLTAVATDTSGTAVAVFVQQDTNGDGFNDAVGDFCGETTEAIEINPGLPMNIFVGHPTACPGSVALGGSITFTLANLPPEEPEAEAEPY